MRQLCDPRSLWLLTGLANRTGQAMGLHRERSLKDLRPFEAEIRRRLWWHILMMDSRSAQLLGTAVDAHFDSWDTRRPLNVDDSDLFPSMKELPPEHSGATEMLFCSIRFEIGKCMRILENCERNGRRTSGSASMLQQNSAIDELENRLEQGLLRTCDPFVLFHILATNLARSSLCQMRLLIHRPQ